MFEMPFVARTRAEAEAWQARIRGRLMEIVERQNPRRNQPLEVRFEELEPGDGYRVYDVRFSGNEGDDIEATWTRPIGTGPFPGVLCLHGHGGDRYAVHDPSTIYRALATPFARSGFATLAPTLAHCEYAPNQLWNLKRALDVLSGLPDVDAERLGVAGLSMGAEWAMWLSACDERVRAAVISGWLCTTEGVLRVPNCPCWCPPGLVDLCDIAEVHLCIAPRPVLFESASRDECFPIDATRAAFEQVQAGYAVFGASDAVQQDVFDSVHEWYGHHACEFMARHLE